MRWKVYNNNQPDLNISKKMDPPVSANVSFQQRMEILWQSNKPLVIAMIVAIALIIVGIILLIVFLAIRPSNSAPATETAANTEAAAEEAAHHVKQVYLHLRNKVY